MDNNKYTTSFSRAVLAGLFTGLIAAVAVLLYDIIYRDYANVSAAKIIMPVTIFIGLPVLGAVAGYIYFLLHKYLHAGKGGFIVCCLVLLAGCTMFTVLKTTNSGGIFSGTRWLYLGIEILACVLAALLIPYFARHPEVYET
jgi:hypothetical protein